MYNLAIKAMDGFWQEGHLYHFGESIVMLSKLEVPGKCDFIPIS